MDRGQGHLHLARDVLDKEILDSDGFKAGKVDDVALDLAAGATPVVRAIVTQHGALARRLGRPSARIAARLRKIFLGLGPFVRPVDIGWEHVTKIDVTVHIDLDRQSMNMCQCEEAVWSRWISRLPWAER